MYELYIHCYNTTLVTEKGVNFERATIDSNEKNCVHNRQQSFSEFTRNSLSLSLSWVSHTDTAQWNVGVAQPKK